MKNSSSFFRNYECEHFPCHKVKNSEDFNCLFCYCPLYHLEECGGNFKFTDGGMKDCTECILPHKAKNYKYIANTLAASM